MLVMDTANIVRFANPSACRLFGREQDVLVGADFGLPVIPGEMIEVDVVRPNGEPGVAEIRVEPTEWEGDEALLVMLIDVTEQKRAEHTIKETVEELKNANQKILEQQKAVIEEERLKVLLQMAGATAHELNQPLTTLLGNIELMRLNRERPEELEGNLERIEKAGRRISQIVRKIQTIRHDETRPYLENADIINFDQVVRILSVEDEVSYFRAMQRMLRKDGNLDLIHAATHAAAMEILERQHIDLILLDHLMPGGDSFDFFERMNEQDLVMPVVIITGQGDEVIATQVIQAGAYDYLPKTSVGRNSLKRSIFNALEKFRLKQEVHRAMDKMAEMSTRDALTGLYNRRYFKESLEKEMDRSRRYGKGLALCMIDLDHFKRVNDTFGHAAGDSVLKELTGLLRQSIRKSDIPCRYGGEEFAVILPEADDVRATVVAKRFRQMVETHAFTGHDPPIRLTVSVGIAAGPTAENSGVDTIVEAADRALYRAKEGGRNRVILSETEDFLSSIPVCNQKERA
jgi:two-component system cell cycle response regulator